MLLAGDYEAIECFEKVVENKGFHRKMKIKYKWL